MKDLLFDIYCIINRERKVKKNEVSIIIYSPPPKKKRHYCTKSKIFFHYQIEKSVVTFRMLHIYYDFSNKYKIKSLCEFVKNESYEAFKSHRTIDWKRDIFYNFPWRIQIMWRLLFLIFISFEVKYKFPALAFKTFKLSRRKIYICMHFKFP